MSAGRMPAVLTVMLTLFCLAPAHAGPAGGRHGASPGKPGRLLRSPELLPVADTRSPSDETGVTEVLSILDPDALADDDGAPAVRSAALAKLHDYDAHRQAALAMTDPMARELSLQRAQARLAEAFHRLPLSGGELARINALVDNDAN